MSYRNPARIVDTQSGQSFRNMQESLARTFTGVINADTARIIKESEKAEKEQSLVIQKIEKQDQAARDAAVQSSVESGTDTVWNLDSLLEANAYATGLKPGQRTEDDKKVLTNARNLKPVLMGAMSNVVSYEETFKSVIAKQAGSEGGLNRYSKTNADKIKGLSIFYSGKNGRSEGTVDPYSGVASLKAYWKGDGGEELVTEISSKGVDIELDTVPETKQSRVDMTANLLKMMKLEKGNSDVFIGAKATSRVEEGTNRIIWSRKPTREAVEKALYTDALATVMGMSAAEGIVWNNNRAGITPKSKEFIKSSYTDEEKYIKNEKGLMVPRPEVVAIAKALAKNALDTEGQELLANIEFAGVGAPNTMSVAERKYYDDIKAKQEESQLIAQEVETDVVDIYNNPSGFFEGLTIKGIGSGEIRSAKVTGDGKIELKTAKGSAKENKATGKLTQGTETHTLDLGSDTGIRQFAEIKYPSDKQKLERRKFEKELMLYRDYQAAKNKSGSGGKLEDIGTYEEFKSKQINKGDQIFKNKKVSNG